MLNSNDVAKGSFYVAGLSLVVAVAAIFVALFFESNEAQRRDQEIAALRAELALNDTEAEFRESIIEVLGQRLSSEVPDVDLYSFPLREYYDYVNFPVDAFLSDVEEQRDSFRETFLVVSEIDWESAVINEDDAVVTAVVQAFRQLRSDDNRRECHDSTRSQSQELALQVGFERGPDGDLLIVSERSVPLSPVVCV